MNREKHAPGAVAVHRDAGRDEFPYDLVEVPTTTLPLATDSLGTVRTMDTGPLAAAFPLASPHPPAPLPGGDPPTGRVL